MPARRPGQTGSGPTRVRIAVIGCGYVGLVTGLCFAEQGHQVRACEIAPDRLRALQRGASPFYEPELEALLRAQLAAGRFSVGADAGACVHQADVAVVAVGTPARADGHPELDALWAAVDALAPQLPSAACLLLKSTVPAGTGTRVAARLQALRQRLGLAPIAGVLSNPEFLREGSALADCRRPDRVILGCDGPRPPQLAALYAPCTAPDRPLLWMDRRSAELSKYAANAMLATKISLMNELSRLCEHVGADIEQVRRGIGSDARIGAQGLHAGLGYGGSCFPKDVQALCQLADAARVPLHILRAVAQTNALQRQRFCDQLTAHFGDDLHGRRIALWGLAFKPGTDDLREAPALFVLAQLLQAGAQVVAHDPVALSNARRQLAPHARLQLTACAYDALADADALCILTEWPQYRRPDFARMRAAMAQFTIFDGRNLYDGDAAGGLEACDYRAVGRPAAPPRRASEPAS